MQRVSNDFASRAKRTATEMRIMAARGKTEIVKNGGYRITEGRLRVEFASYKKPHQDPMYTLQLYLDYTRNGQKGWWARSKQYLSTDKPHPVTINHEKGIAKVGSYRIESKDAKVLRALERVAQKWGFTDAPVEERIRKAAVVQARKKTETFLKGVRERVKQKKSEKAKKSALLGIKPKRVQKKVVTKVVRRRPKRA